MSDHTPIAMSVHVVHGKRPGPVVFVSAAVHGDEIIGVEVARRLLQNKALSRLRGTLLVVPIVNTFGFMNQSRYLPDRRDLNRSFPGTESGSMAGRIANLFFTEVVQKSDYGIDLHSAAIHRTNLPQIRIAPRDRAGMDLARVFGAPVTLLAKVREGSLRHAAAEHGTKVLLFEAGESLRFDEMAIRAGTSGILRVLRHLDMISGRGIAQPKENPVICYRSRWQRSPAGGLLRSYKRTGTFVKKGEVLGIISDPFGEVEQQVKAQIDGIIIGRTNLPVVYEGDGLYHLAEAKSENEAIDTIESLVTQLENDPFYDEDEII
ncbi:succinylglutamate desuccinylase/aspartoacylase family protein [Pseudovibrio exalbescens]|uniref:succinylglutamate desuccinylase/aspartoacylase family protein n=2 Tax=Stappiaceae TaxID=2821832 RepID=UPI002364FC1B|nr:succinylglutamate desuccinylase/aspartoacylase family protein [Pseudovibrio exalbescens]MDD7911067.1 succinylglutamate desuccinylase/aspartoacylase family protein [Pseudovibrio exalbescens]MDX5595284.1 succinylglutamate desuccinylase/aspartoacylase family protein [Pseudovibrio sp. SPO723]